MHFEQIALSGGAVPDILQNRQKFGRKLARQQLLTAWFHPKYLALG
jgi:hypothetical protein